MKKVLFSLSLLTVLLSGCVCDDSELFGIADKKKIEEAGSPLNVMASISESTSNLRSIITGITFPSPSSIGVFAIGGGGTVTNTQYNLSGTTWSASSPIYIVNQNATVYGFCPYAATTPSTPTAAATIPITITNEASFTGAGQTDYLWATPTPVSKASTINVSLPFKHALSKVSFIVNKGANFVGTGTLTSITLGKGGYTGSPVMKISDGTISGGTSTVISFTGSQALNVYESTTVNATGLVAPTASLLTTNISIIVDGITYSTTLPTTSVTSWAAATNYTYTLTIGAGQLSVSSPTITDWATGGSEAISY